MEDTSFSHKSRKRTSWRDRLSHPLLSRAGKSHTQGRSPDLSAREGEPSPPPLSLLRSGRTKKKTPLPNKGGSIAQELEPGKEKLKTDRKLELKMELKQGGEKTDPGVGEKKQGSLHSHNTLTLSSYGKGLNS